MSYVRHVLQPGETVVQESRLHWLIYWRAILFLIIAAILALLSLLPTDATAAEAILAAAALALLVALISAIAAAIRRATTELAVTNHRIIYKSGLFSRHTIEMNRAKVESVDVDQSLLGRIFGYGTVQVRGTGGSLEPLRGIENPLSLRSHITVG